MGVPMIGPENAITLQSFKLRLSEGPEKFFAESILAGFSAYRAFRLRTSAARSAGAFRLSMVHCTPKSCIKPINAINHKIEIRSYLFFNAIP
jgi:hypothetical protein